MVLACNLFLFELHVRTFKIEKIIPEYIYIYIFDISLQTIGVDINHNASDIRITPIVDDDQHSLLIP
jgi:hypothetical protein